MNMHESNYDVNNDKVKTSLGELLNVGVVVHYEEKIFGMKYLFFFISYFVWNIVFFVDFFRNVNINIIVCSTRMKQREHISIICKLRSVDILRWFDKRVFCWRDELIDEQNDFHKDNCGRMYSLKAVIVLFSLGVIFIILFVFDNNQN